MSLPPSLRRVLREASGPGEVAPIGRLLEIQFWLMGRDVEHPSGNLLVTLGFTREPAPQPGLPSRYQRLDGDGTHVVVWPCGLYLGSAGHRCVLIRGWRPAAVGDERPHDLYDPAEVYAMAHRGGSCPPEALGMVSRWFAHYERSVLRTAGVGHRVPRRGTHPSLAPRRPCSLAQPWDELADLVGEHEHEVLRQW